VSKSLCAKSKARRAAGLDPSWVERPPQSEAKPKASLQAMPKQSFLTATIQQQHQQQQQQLALPVAAAPAAPAATAAEAHSLVLEARQPNYPPLSWQMSVVDEVMGEPAAVAAGSGRRMVDEGRRMVDEVMGEPAAVPAGSGRLIMVGSRPPRRKPLPPWREPTALSADEALQALEQSVGAAAAAEEVIGEPAAVPAGSGRLIMVGSRPQRRNPLPPWREPTAVSTDEALHALEQSVGAAAAAEALEAGGEHMCTADESGQEPELEPQALKAGSGSSSSGDRIRRLGPPWKFARTRARKTWAPLKGSVLLTPPEQARPQNYFAHVNDSYGP